MFAETHVGILSIDDCVTHVYFYFVGAGRDVQNLRMIVAGRFLSGLTAIDENERSRRGTGHDELRLVRQGSFPRTEPTASGYAGQCKQYEDSQSVCPRIMTKT
jgi:hypothetical protein